MRSWTMWLCASLFYAYQYVLRVIPNVLKHDLSTVFQFDSLLFGQFAGVYYIGYTLAHIPLGLLLDRYGPKWVLPAATFISVLGMLPLLFCDSFFYPIVGRFVLGLGSSCAFIGLVKIVQLAFSPEKFNKMLSYGSIFGLIGGMFAGAPVHYLLQFLGWKSVIAISITLGVALSLLMLFIIPKTQVQNIKPIGESLKIILTNKWFWICSLSAGFMVGPAEGYADAWVVQTLTVIYSISKDWASHAVSLFYLSFGIGLAGLSYSSDKIGYDKTIIISGCFMLISFILLIGGYIDYLFVPLLLFVLGFFSAFQVPALCRVATFFPQSMSSLTTSVANTILMLFGTFFHSTLGGCMHYFSPMDQCVTDVSLFQKGFMVIPIALCLGIFGFSYIARFFKNNTR